MPNVKCPDCKKNRPHGHKGCNEVGLSRTQIGEFKKRDGVKK